MHPHPDPTEMNIPQAVRYVRDHYREPITRVTLYNWMSRGRVLDSGHVEVLPFRQGRTRRYIKVADLDKFLREIG